MVIWVVVSLYLVCILTFSIPSVQKFFGRKVAGVLAEKLGTSVSIDRLEYRLFSHVTLYGVLIKDQQGEDMLKANRLSTRIDLLPLAEGKISIATAQLFGMHAKLYQRTAESQPNFQFVIDSLASKDTTNTTPLNLRINSLLIRRSSVCFDRLDVPETQGQLNPNHLMLTDISTHIVLKQFSEDSLNINVKRLSLKEKSGMEIKRLSLYFDGGHNGFNLSNFQLHLPGTDIALGDLKASYRFRDEHFIVPSLRYMGSIQPSTITLSDLSFLLPSLKTFQSTLSLEADFQGEGETLQVPRLVVNSTTGDISIDLKGDIQQLRQSEPLWSANISRLGLSAKTVSFISENLQGQSVHVPKELVRLGNISLNGIISGKGLSGFSARNQINTDAGNIDIQMALKNQRQFKGRISADHFDLKRLLDDDHFGHMATTLELNGQLLMGELANIKAEGVIQHLYYHGYDYQNILLNGQYSPSNTRGAISIDESNIKARIEGFLVRNDQHNNIQMEVNVSHLKPKAINLSDKWGDARFSGNLHVNVKAHDINDAVGSLDLKSLTMQSSKENYQLKQLHIKSGYANNQHHITLHSDFGNAHIIGDFDFQTLTQSITNFVADKLPTLPGLPKVNLHTKNNFSLQITINKSDWLQKLLLVPINLTKPLTLEGMINDYDQQLTLKCNLPQFYYKNSRYDNGHLSIISPLGTLAYELGVTKQMDDGKQMDIQLTGSAFNNQLTTNLLWDNHAEDLMSGRVTAKAFFNATIDGKQEAIIDIVPSTMTINNTIWDIQPANIIYTTEHIDINHFTIRHNEQFLSLNGVVSESSQDSISVQMRDIDIEYILNLLNFHAVEFSGQATGGGNLRGVFGEFEAEGQLKVQQFKFQRGRMGTLNAQVEWNKEKEQIDIYATADDGPDAQTFINGYVSPKRNYIDLGIQAQGTHLDFAHSFMDSFISNLEGHADGFVQLAGHLDALNLTGQLVINGVAHVSTLGCDYELRGDTLKLEPNEIIFNRFPIYDINGTEAVLSGAIHHQELTNLTFDIYVNANNLLAYHFSDFGTDTFYGTVYATGMVGIHGRGSGVTIEADITPEQGSRFVYNAASPTAITSQEFIQWGSQTIDDVQAFNCTEETQSLTYRDDLTLRMKINATPHAEICLLMDANTNDYITLQGNGILQATYYNKRGFSLFGTYRVTEGAYGLTIQNIIRKNFIFKEGGTIVFGGDPYEASLNLQAQHIVTGVSLSDLNVGSSFSNTVRVNCLMNITGRPRQPIIDFDLEMPNVNADEQQMVRSIINSDEEMNQQVIYLLAVGRFYPQSENNANNGEDSPSKTSLALQSLLSGTISGQINDILGQVVKSNKWNFGANISTGDEGWNNAEYEGLISGRLLNNRLLINGQFGYRDNATTATSSFIGDFDISYLLLPNGNLALKVYNQTNDRYFTRSSLNTQGIGILIKKDFNSLPDLFGVRKQRKKK